MKRESWDYSPGRVGGTLNWLIFVFHAGILFIYIMNSEKRFDDTSGNKQKIDEYLSGQNIKWCKPSAD